jgi:hypothetical protein
MVSSSLMFPNRKFGAQNCLDSTMERRTSAAPLATFTIALQPRPAFLLLLPESTPSFGLCAFYTLIEPPHGGA